MTVEEYFEEWWTPKELPKNGFNKTAMLDFAEMYHKQALRIHDVSGRSEQFICHECNKSKDEWLHGICEDCTLKGFTDGK